MKTQNLFFLLSVFLANVLNFLFNAYIVRAIPLDIFAEVTLFNSFLSLLGILVISVQSAVTHHVALDPQDSVSSPVANFYKYLPTGALLLCLLWVGGIPFLNTFFQISDPFFLVLFAPVILLSLFMAVERGFLQGKFLFLFLGVTILVETLTKFLAGIFLTLGHFYAYIYLAIPLSILLGWGITFMIVHTLKLKPSFTINFPFPFFGAMFLISISTTLLISADILLIKHFFSPLVAGEYSLLSLGGKMIYFVSILFNGLVIAYGSSSFAQKRKSDKNFWKFLTGLTGLLTLLYIGLGLFGNYTLVWLFGRRVESILSLVPWYCLAMLFYSLANIITIYFLTQHRYIFAILSCIFSTLFIVSISFFHQSLNQVVMVMSILTGGYLVAVLVLAFVSKKVVRGK